MSNQLLEEKSDVLNLIDSPAYLTAIYMNGYVFTSESLGHFTPGLCLILLLSALVLDIYLEEHFRCRYDEVDFITLTTINCLHLQLLLN
jgi:hypothetical protein